jgi:hypothetical protein
MKKYLFLLFTICFTLSVTAQKKFTLSGYIKDAATGESLIGATLLVNGNTKGISSNQYGFYSLTLNAGNYELVASSLGYQSFPFILNLQKDTVVNIALNSGTALSEEVVITSRKRESNVKNAQMGKVFILTLQLEKKMK